jgi:hypothetical protein
MSRIGTGVISVVGCLAALLPSCARTDSDSAQDRTKWALEHMSLDFRLLARTSEWPPPKDADAFVDYLSKVGRTRLSDFGADAWGRPYRLTVEDHDAPSLDYEFRSAGADGQYDTPDDLVVGGTVSWKSIAGATEAGD